MIRRGTRRMIRRLPTRRKLLLLPRKTIPRTAARRRRRRKRRKRSLPVRIQHYTSGKGTLY
jgi:hypothetical protein